MNPSPVNLSGGTSFKDLVGGPSSGIIGLVNSTVVPIIFALAFGFFIWGVVKYFFLHGDNDTARAEGQQFILWGIVGMAVLFSVWGLVNLLLSTLGLA